MVGVLVLTVFVELFGAATTLARKRNRLTVTTASISAATFSPRRSATYAHVAKAKMIQQVFCLLVSKELIRGVYAREFTWIASEHFSKSFLFHAFKFLSPKNFLLTATCHFKLYTSLLLSAISLNCFSERRFSPSRLRNVLINFKGSFLWGFMLIITFRWLKWSSVCRHISCVFHHSSPLAGGLN